MTQNRQHQCPLSRRFSNHGHTVQYMLRYPHIYCQQQIDQQRAYEVDHPAECHDFGDRGHLLSCDSIESVEHLETREERHLRWLREANNDPYDQDIPQPHVFQPVFPSFRSLAATHTSQLAIPQYPSYDEDLG